MRRSRALDIGGFFECEELVPAEGLPPLGSVGYALHQRPSAQPTAAIEQLGKLSAEAFVKTLAHVTELRVGLHHAQNLLGDLGLEPGTSRM